MNYILLCLLVQIDREEKTRGERGKKIFPDAKTTDLKNETGLEEVGHQHVFKQILLQT